MLDKIVAIYEDSEFNLTLSRESGSTSKAVFTAPGSKDEVSIVWGQGDTVISLKLTDPMYPDEVHTFTSQEEAITRLEEIILC